MTPTDETLADLWRTGDKRQIMTALQRYIGFHVAWSEDHPQVNGYVWIESYYPGNELVELSDDTCIKMTVPELSPEAQQLLRQAKEHAAMA